MKIAFLIGDTAIGGGTYVILQHALFLHKSGHAVTILYLFNQCTPWHEAFDVLNFSDLNKTPCDAQFDIAIGTWWKTVFYLEHIDAKKKIYFVQSIESYFVKDDSNDLKKKINSTYEVGLPVITEASWIQKFLKKKYNTESMLVPNGVRKDYLFPRQGQCLKKRILIEGPVDVDFKNVPRTIALCRKNTSWEIWLLTSSPISRFPGVSKVFSNIAASKVGDIYRECDILVKLSYVEGMFGPPLEMFHCGGTAIAYNVTGHDEYMHNNYNSIIIQEGNEKDLTTALCTIQNSPQVLARLKKNALITASLWPDWTFSSQKFAEALFSLNQPDYQWKKLYHQHKNQPCGLLRATLGRSSLIKKIKHKIMYYILSPFIYPLMPHRGKRKKEI